MEDDEPICTTFADMREAISPSFGCDADELVVTVSTTDSISKILGGLELNAGDEILTTNHEFYGALSPMALARDRHGVVIKQVKLPVGNDQCAEDYVERFSAAITSRTKVLLFSAPTALTGTMLPIQMLTELAQRRGLISVIDGAHIPGMLDVNFHKLGADFIAGSGNKWQCGPPGTGILYIRNKVLLQHNPAPLPTFWPIISTWYPLAGGLPPRTANSTPSYDIAEYVQNVGSASLRRMQALRRACDTWNEFGRDRIERYIVGLSAYLKARIAEHWGEAAIYSPYRDARLATALTSFNPLRNPDDAFNEALFQTFVARLESEYRILLKYTQFEVEGAAAPHHAIRISTRLYHNRDDINELVEAMEKVANDMA
ncbi:aminotransferase class V-fold PLP-dependent enzyme [Bradyrhizobium sp. AUGA SZCCT0431]|nr:aminotransferase class V-fold PLP-dependent enzyme [Bradyrhizobium sp. AUGA SZCCT0431]